MNNTIDNQIKKYLKEIKRGITDYGANGDEIAKDLEMKIAYFVERYPSAKFSDIEEEFGTAESIIEGFYSPSELAKARRNKRIMKISILCGTVLAILIILWVW